MAGKYILNYIIPIKKIPTTIILKLHQVEEATLVEEIQMICSQQRSLAQGGGDLIEHTMSLVRRSFIILLFMKMMIYATVPVVEPVDPTISVVETLDQASLFLEPRS